MGTVPNPNPISVASFSSVNFYYQQLLASETVSRSGTLTGPAPGTLVPRGTVLFGNIVGVPQTTPYTVGSGTQARAILAADATMPATGPANILAYIQGKFLQSGMTFSAAGPAADAAGLWEFGIYVLDVMDQNGLMVPLPLDTFEQKEGPARMTDEDLRKALAIEIAKIRAAGPTAPPVRPDDPDKDRPHHSKMPAYAYVAFDTTPEKEDEAEREAIERRRQLAQRPVDPGYGVPRPVPPSSQLPHEPGASHDPRPPSSQLPHDPGHDHEIPPHGEPKRDAQPKHVDQPKDSKK